VSVDRVFCINALHHFDDRVAFAREAHRILRSGGTVMVIGLDPHTALDRWWIYDYFPGALAADLVRYPSVEAIRATLEDAGFSDLTTSVAQHIPAAVPFDLAVERGYVDRRSTSQLMVISDAEYEEGVRRLTAERPVLRADLRLYATVGRVLGTC
jgi:SAM-dependent methyltransferase